jgi:quinol monooxygenase YgiN
MSDSLDAMIGMAGLPVREETLEQAWGLTAEAPAAGRMAILVTLPARPGMAAELEQAAAEFVDATGRLTGALGSTQHRSSADPLLLILVEQFANRTAFERHMASDYFRRFQLVQAPLLAGPVEVVFLERPDH